MYRLRVFALMAALTALFTVLGGYFGGRQGAILFFVLAAVITPSGDPVTLMMLAVPMLILYFVAVLVGWLLTRRRPADD